LKEAFQAAQRKLRKTYLKHCYESPQKGVEVFTVTFTFPVLIDEAKLATEKMHSQNAVSTTA